MRNQRGKQSLAGGAILALSIIAGTIAGVILREPSVGVLAGFGAGLLFLLAIWLWDRRA